MQRLQLRQRGDRLLRLRDPASQRRDLPLQRLDRSRGAGGGVVLRAACSALRVAARASRGRRASAAAPPASPERCRAELRDLRFAAAAAAPRASHGSRARPTAARAASRAVPRGPPACREARSPGSRARRTSPAPCGAAAWAFSTPRRRSTLVEDRQHLALAHRVPGADRHGGEHARGRGLTRECLPRAAAWTRRRPSSRPLRLRDADCHVEHGHGETGAATLTRSTRVSPATATSPAGGAEAHPAIRRGERSRRR